MRRLNCQIPHVRESWKRHYKNFLIQNKLISRQLHLEQELMNSAMTEELKKKFEKILQQRQEGIAYADRKCRKLRCGNVPYSKDFAQASTTIQVWKAAATIKTGSKYSSRLFRRLEKQVGLSQCLSKSLKEIKTNEEQAWKDYWQVKKNAHSLRKSFLMQKAEDIAEESETLAASNVYKQLLTREQQRDDARKIKGTLKKLQKLSVHTLEVTNDDGSTAEITKKGTA